MLEIVNALKQSGFKPDEIQDIIEAEDDFLHTGVLYDFSQVQLNARKELFASQPSSHVSA